MKVGLIDVDGHNFPNLPLMKLSAWHKKQGHCVEWYEPLFSSHMDIVYMSKVFTFTPDYPYHIHADRIVKGGTGYFYPDGGEPLPAEVEHIYPDYSLYPECRDTAYGFLTRGCPRQCDFCLVAKKEGRQSKKVADLDEFWNGQKSIKLLDPNLLACKGHKELLQQLIDSLAWVDFTQGLDARLLTLDNVELIKQVRVKTVHFAWDRLEDGKFILPKLKMFKEVTGWDKRKMVVYVLTNFDTTHEQDLERIYTLRDLGYWPYVMIYEKEKLPKRHITRKLQRWVNMRAIFESIKDFRDYTG